MPRRAKLMAIMPEVKNPIIMPSAVSSMVTAARSVPWPATSRSQGPIHSV